MSDDTNVSTDAQTNDNQEQDQTNNLKAEMARKLGNLQEQINSKNEETAQKLDAISQLLAQQTQLQQQASALKQEDLEDLKYTDPDKYIQLQKESIKKEILGEVQTTSAAEAARQTTLVNLSRQYPELNDESSALFKAATQIHGTLSQSLQNTAEGYEIAVARAAAQEGMLPKSKRASKGEEDSDVAEEFIGGRSTATQKQASKKSDQDIDPLTDAFARLTGLDMDDKEQRERIKERAQRKNWSKWTAVPTKKKKGGR